MSEVSKQSRLAIALVEAGVEPKKAISVSESEAVKELLADDAAPAPNTDTGPVSIMGAPTADRATAEFYDGIRKAGEARNAKGTVPSADEVAARIARAPIGRGP